MEQQDQVKVPQTKKIEEFIWKLHENNQKIRNQDYKKKVI